MFARTLKTIVRRLPAAMLVLLPMSLTACDEPAGSVQSFGAASVKSLPGGGNPQQALLIKSIIK